MKLNKKRLLSFACTLVFSGAVATAVAAPADVSAIKGLLDAGKPAEAYALGKSNSSAMADQDFALLFGIAALDSGHVAEGAKVLEDFVKKHPGHRTGEFHLARAYFLLNDDAHAQAGFDRLTKGASEQDMVLINMFRNAITARKANTQPTLSYFAETGVGYDSNVNAGVNAGQIAGLPTGYVVGDGATNRKSADGFTVLAGGINGSYPIQPGKLIAFGGLSGNGRWNMKGKNSQFDQTGLQLNGGIGFLDGASLYRAGVAYSELQVDNAKYLTSGALTGEWQYQLDQANRIGVAGQYARLTYTDQIVYADMAKTIPINSGAHWMDSDLSILNGSWTHSLNMPMNPVVTGVVFGGHEQNRHSRSDLSRNLYGAKVGVNLTPAAKWLVSAGLGYTESKYDAEFAPGSPVRRDDMLTFDLTANYSFTRNWSVRGEYSHTHQNSNIGLYAYNRDVIAAKVRYDFN